MAKLIEKGDSVLIFHVDANSAYLSWTVAVLLEEGFGNDIRKIPSAIAGDPENRHGIILTKSIIFSAAMPCIGYFMITHL